MQKIVIFNDIELLYIALKLLMKLETIIIILRNWFLIPKFKKNRENKNYFYYFHFQATFASFSLRASIKIVLPNCPKIMWNEQNIRFVFIMAF